MIRVKLVTDGFLSIVGENLYDVRSEKTGIHKNRIVIVDAESFEIMKEALEFYANEFNWATHKEDDLCRLDLTIKDDANSYGELNDDNISVLVKVGGRRAQEALKKIEELNKESE